MMLSISFGIFAFFCLVWITHILKNTGEFIKEYKEAKRKYIESGEYFYDKRYHRYREDFYPYFRGQLYRFLFALAVLLIFLHYML